MHNVPLRSFSPLRPLRPLSALVAAIGVLCLSSFTAHAQEGYLAAHGPEVRQLDRAIDKSRGLHARPRVSAEQIVLALTDRINAQEGARYSPVQVVEMLEITPAQMDMLQRGVGFDQVGIVRHPAFVAVKNEAPSAGSAPEQSGGLEMNKKAP